MVLAGCPGSLANPEDFMDGMGGGGMQTKTVQDVFDESCATAGCHDDVTMASNLDLLSANVEERVVDVNSTATGCTSEILVVAGDPDSSYLLDKVLGTAACGGRMPLVGSLPDSDIDIIRQWIIDLGTGGAGGAGGTGGSGM